MNYPTNVSMECVGGLSDKRDHTKSEPSEALLSMQNDVSMTL